MLLNAAAGILAHDGIGQPAADGFEDRFRAAHAEAASTLDSGAPATLLARWAAASQESLAANG